MSWRVVGGIIHISFIMRSVNQLEKRVELHSVRCRIPVVILASNILALGSAASPRSLKNENISATNINLKLKLRETYRYHTAPRPSINSSRMAPTKIPPTHPTHHCPPTMDPIPPACILPLPRSPRSSRESMMHHVRPVDCVDGWHPVI
jgi:hypothetical protein